MARAKKLLKACIACVILCLAFPNQALGQYYETNYTEQYNQPVEESRSENSEKQDDDGGLPWWVWAIIIWIGLGWLADSDSDSQSTESQPRRTTRPASRRNPYVIDPSR